jgi:hypothetical protein
MKISPSKMPFHREALRYRNAVTPAALGGRPANSGPSLVLLKLSEI